MQDKVTKHTLPYPENCEPNILIPTNYCKIRFAIGKMGGNPLIVICMNPSAAKDTSSDRTINRIIRISKDLNMDGWVVFNIYPERATDPKNIDNYNDELSKENINIIKNFLTKNNIHEVLGAWGDEKHDSLRKGKRALLNMLYSINVKVFYYGTLTKLHNPRHPLQRVEKEDFLDKNKHYLSLSKSNLSNSDIGVSLMKRIYMHKMDMNKNIFNDIEIFEFAEGGAMGNSGYIEFITANGKLYYLDYMHGDVTEEDLIKCFPKLPKLLNFEPDISNEWKTVSLGAGNYLFISSSLYKYFQKHIENTGDIGEIYQWWKENAIKALEERKEEWDMDDYTGGMSINVSLAMSEEQAVQENTVQCLFPELPFGCKVYFLLDKIPDEFIDEKTLGWEIKIKIKKERLDEVFAFLYPDGLKDFDYKKIADKIKGEFVWIIGFGD